MLSAQSGSSGAPGEMGAASPQIASLGWVLRRAAWGLVVLALTVTLGAWLLYASIDPDEAAAGASEPTSTTQN